MKKINKNLLIGAFLLGIVILMCITSFFYLPYAPDEMDSLNTYLKPGASAAHLLGTDHFGRDILSRIMVGSRTVLLIGFVSVTLGAAEGIFLGTIAAMVKGIIGSVIMRAIEGLMAFPGTLLALMLVAVIGKGEHGAIIAISIYTIAPFARLTNTLILENEAQLSIKAAHSFSVSGPRLFMWYYLPALLPKLLTQFSTSVGSAIMTEASLSFLGLGVQPPGASWGLMLSEAKQYALLYPYLAVAPGIAIFMTVLSFHLISDGLNDILIERRTVAWPQSKRR
jgi:ABC-type dipeptide/oligopeptide/nickel transport system permease subunit